MKNILTILVTVMWVAVLVAPVLARELKVPKEICWSYDNNRQFIAVGTKKETKVRFSYGKETFYSVSGLQYEDYWVPASGSAYTVKDADGHTWLRMELTANSNSVTFYSFEIHWNLDTGSGGMIVLPN